MYLVKTTEGKILYMGDDSAAAMTAFFHEKSGAQYFDLDKEQLSEELARLGYKAESKTKEEPGWANREQAFAQAKDLADQTTKLINKALSDVGNFIQEHLK